MGFLVPTLGNEIKEHCHNNYLSALRTDYIFFVFKDFIESLEASRNVKILGDV